MFINCFGIKKQEDVELVRAFLEENGIQHKMADPLTLFEEDEAEYRLTELSQVVNEKGELVEVTEELIFDVADALGNEDYLDYDALTDLVCNELKSHNLMLKWDYNKEDKAQKIEGRFSKYGLSGEYLIKCIKDAIEKHGSDYTRVELVENIDTGLFKARILYCSQENTFLVHDYMNTDLNLAQLEEIFQTYGVNFKEQ